MNFFSWKRKDPAKREVEKYFSTKGDHRDLSSASALDLMGVGFMVLDSKSCISEANESCKDFLDIASVAIGSPVVEIIKAHELVQLFKSVKNEGSIVEEISGPVAGGLTFLVSLTYEAISEETLVVLLDTTRINKLESVRRDFITNLSHELRTPVSVIHANAEALVDGALQDKKAAKSFSSAILKSSEKLTSLLSDVLNLATIESGEYSLDIHDVNPKTIIEEVVNNISEQFSTASIDVELEDDLLVKMDSQAFEQIFTNLLENAVKYSLGEKNPIIQVRSRNIGAFIRFEIEDHGMGISPENRERVFERFFRVQNQDTLSISGTGLGLSIVKNLVNLMGGSVGNESAHPKGTIFWFSLYSSS